jgi:uncharacterized protein
MSNSGQPNECVEHNLPQPATAIVSHRVCADKIEEYRLAQTAISRAARNFPGFIGTEVLSPVLGLQEEWIVIFRLESNQAMKRWLESTERTALADKIEDCLTEPSHLLVLASDERGEPPAAMVFACRVREAGVPDYLAWRRKVIAAEAHIPGYLATECFEPRAKGQKEWVDIVRYDSAEHLEAWMQSKERAELLEELDPLVESLHSHQVTGLEGWFAINRQSAEPFVAPPAWKQGASVLLALYPTVMILSLLTSRPLRSLSFPVQMMIRNMLSVALLTWLVMPLMTRWLGFWLNIPSRKTDARGRAREGLGILIVTGFLVLFVGIFRLLW